MRPRTFQIVFRVYYLSTLISSSIFCRSKPSSCWVPRQIHALGVLFVTKRVQITFLFLRWNNDRNWLHWYQKFWKDTPSYFDDKKQLRRQIQKLLSCASLNHFAKPTFVQYILCFCYKCIVIPITSTVYYILPLVKFTTKKDSLYWLSLVFPSPFCDDPYIYCNSVD